MARKKSQAALAHAAAEKMADVTPAAPAAEPASDGKAGYERKCSNAECPDYKKKVTLAHHRTRTCPKCGKKTLTDMDGNAIMASSGGSRTSGGKGKSKSDETDEATGLLDQLFKLRDDAAGGDWDNLISHFESPIYAALDKFPIAAHKVKKLVYKLANRTEPAKAK